MNRRDFLLGSVVLPTVAAAAAEKPAPASNEWAAVREQFELSSDKVNASLFFLASHPRAVREAIERYRKGLDADAFSYIDAHHDEYDEAVNKAAAAYLDVKPEELALTDSTTMGLGLFYGGFKLEPGAEVLATEHDHYSTLTSLEHRKARDGITVKTVKLYDAPETATAAKMTEAILRAVNSKTRLVHVTWVHSCSGVKVPVRAIADGLAKLNAGKSPETRALLVVDGVHGLGSDDTSLPKLGCDVFIAGTHKWLFGPRGTGIVWAKADVWPFVQPVIPTFSFEAYGQWMGVTEKKPIAAAVLCTPGGFHSFEHRWALADAFTWHASLGKAKVQARIAALNKQFKEGVAKMKHVKLHTPMDPAISAGICTFDVKGLSELELAKKLGEKGVIASATPYRAPRYGRVSFGILNSNDDVVKVLEAVKSLA